MFCRNISHGGGIGRRGRIQVLDGMSLNKVCTSNRTLCRNTILMGRHSSCAIHVSSRRPEQGQYQGCGQTQRKLSTLHLLPPGFLMGRIQAPIVSFTTARSTRQLVEATRIGLGRQSQCRHLAAAAIRSWETSTSQSTKSDKRKRRRKGEDAETPKATEEEDNQEAKSEPAVAEVDEPEMDSMEEEDEEEMEDHSEGEDFDDDDDVEVSTTKTMNKKEENENWDENVQTNYRGEPYFELTKKRRVTVQKNRDVIYVDFRQYYDLEDRTVPSPKGIVLNRTQYDMFVELIQAGTIQRLVNSMEHDIVQQTQTAKTERKAKEMGKKKKKKKRKS